MTSATPAAASCVPGEGYGTQCETLTGHGLTVSGIEARLTADADFFDHPWTFETTIYRCDPRGRTKQECPPTESVRGSIHRPTPNGVPEMCTRVGDQVGGGCTGTLNVAFPLDVPRRPLGVHRVRGACERRVGRERSRAGGRGSCVPPRALTRARAGVDVYVCDDVRVGSPAKPAARGGIARATIVSVGP